jgi:hypothetical protein
VGSLIHKVTNELPRMTKTRKTATKKGSSLQTADFELALDFESQEYFHYQAKKG